MIYLALIAALAVTIYFYRHTKPELPVSQKILLSSLRFIALSIVLILLMNPIFTFVNKKEIHSKQIILLDDSISMEEKSTLGSKFELARNAALSLQQKLENSNYDAEILRFSSTLSGDRNSSSFANTLMKLQKEKMLQHVTAINLFSDGWLDDNEPDFIDNIQIPVNTYDLNFEASGFDLELSKLRYNQKTWLKEITPLVVEFSATDFDGKANLEFFLENKLIESKPVDFSKEKYQQVVFEYEFMKTGFQELYFKISSDSLGELNSDNNLHPGAVMVVPDKAKISLISDKMTWDGRYIVQAVTKNERFDIDFLVKNSKLMKQNIPVRLNDEIKNTKVLCLINNGNLHFNNSEAKLISNFADNGGGILWMGKPVDELSEILPAGKSGISRLFEGNFVLTSKADQYQSLDVVDKFLDEIPPARFYYTSPKIGSHVLAEFTEEQNPPALIFSEYQQGKILQLSFLDLYKWQLWGENGHYLEFINNSLQWLASSRSESFIVYSDQNSYLMGENVNIILTAFDEKFAPVSDLKAAINIKIDGQDFIQDYMTRDFEQYSYNFIPEKPGNYDVTVSSAETDQEDKTRFVINPANSESRDRGVNKSLLAYLATETGGKSLKDNDFKNNEPLADISYQIIRNEIPVYKKWYTFALFLITFSLEIFFRKRWGLL